MDDLAEQKNKIESKFNEFKAETHAKIAEFQKNPRKAGRRGASGNRESPKT